MDEAVSALRKAALQLQSVMNDTDLSLATEAAGTAISLSQNASRLVAAEKQRIEKLQKMRQVPQQQLSEPTGSS